MLCAAALGADGKSEQEGKPRQTLAASPSREGHLARLVEGRLSAPARAADDATSAVRPVGGATGFVYVLTRVS